MVEMNVASYLPHPILDKGLPHFLLTLNPMKCDLRVGVLRVPHIHGNLPRLKTVAHRDHKLREDERRKADSNSR